MQPARARVGDVEGLSDAAYTNKSDAADTNKTFMITLIIILVTLYELIDYTCHAAADVACAASSIQLPASVCCSCRYIAVRRYVAV